MRYPKLREIKEALTSLVTRPYTTKFPFKPHKPFKKFRGKPVVNDETCVGCEACASVCPADAIKIKDSKASKTRVIERDYGLCIFCGQCEAVCITDEPAVKLSNEIYEMTVFNKKELIETQKKELLVCEDCGTIIGARQHLEYIYKKLGPYAFSQQTVMARAMENLKLIKQKDSSIKLRKDETKRNDFFSILCPTCKRKVLLKNLT
ncbi:MAG: 4Fe-4S dicluster domain-containing protein [Spirochaetes bacterium]|nr:4Fe-4S dicluster domain-containing protein [Spirochaetota bacterium]